MVDADALVAAEAAALDAAKRVVLDLLASRARTRAELAGALRRHGVDEQVATAALDRLEAVGLVDDEAFAQAYVQQRRGSRAQLALATELKRLGIDPCQALEVACAGGDDAERDAALAVARARLSSLKGLQPAAATRRLAGALARRGFTPGMVWSVVREVLGEAGDGCATDH